MKFRLKDDAEYGKYRRKICHEFSNLVAGKITRKTCLSRIDKVLAEVEKFPVRDIDGLCSVVK